MGKHIGNLVKQGREKKKRSQADIAEALGLKTAQSISNIERGVSPLPPMHFKKLGEILGVPKQKFVDAALAEYAIALKKGMRLRAPSGTRSVA